MGAAAIISATPRRSRKHLHRAFERGDTISEFGQTGGLNKKPRCWEFCKKGTRDKRMSLFSCHLFLRNRIMTAHVRYAGVGDVICASGSGTHSKVCRRVTTSVDARAVARLSRRRRNWNRNRMFGQPALKLEIAQKLDINSFSLFFL